MVEASVQRTFYANGVSSTPETLFADERTAKMLLYVLVVAFYI